MIRFALASPSPLVRAGLAAGLDAQGDCAVVLSAATLAELAEADYGGAEIVVVDAGSEADGELDAVALAGPRFIVLAGAADERVGEWLIDGCSVLPIGASADEVAGAGRAALAGLVATTPPYAAEALRFERVGERRGAAPGARRDEPRPRQPRDRRRARHLRAHRQVPRRPDHRQAAGAVACARGREGAARRLRRRLSPSRRPSVAPVKRPLARAARRRRE